MFEYRHILILGFLLSACSGSNGTQKPSGQDSSSKTPLDSSFGEVGADGTGTVPASCNAPLPTGPPQAKPVTDQIIRTISSGRVRQRHESNGTFGGFGDHYFENRSFEFVIEDYTPTGEKRIVVTLKPLGVHGTGKAGDAGLPNFRIFQNGGTNPDLFNSNNTLKDNGDNTFTIEIKDGGGNPQTALTSGRLVGFEFGFFFNKDKVEGRNSYYSDTFRFIVGKPGLVVGVPLTDGIAGNPEAVEPPQALSAGAHTVPLIKAEQDQKLHYSQSSLNIAPKDMQGFLEGRSLFHSNFTSGQHTETGIDFSPERLAKQKGLAGPALDASACASCHAHNGSFSAEEKDRPTHVLKIAKADGSAHDEFGLQIQKSELAKATQLKITSETKVETFADGTKVTLTAPKYTMAGAQISARIPQMVYGLGLLEGVSESDIASLVPCVVPSTGVSGKLSEAIHPKTGRKALGRFGWKAGKISLEHQISEAALLDLGVTTPLFPSESCEKTGKCGAGTPELAAEDVDRLVTYMRTIAVPVQRNVKDERFINGEKVFAKLNCTSCHLPTSYTDNKHPIEKLRGQTFHAYTDLLLHDMGEALSDGKAENNASSSEWRTPPLWGLGLMKIVNGQLLLLHDGRAKSYEEAILWHGGEASAMQAAFRALPKDDRDDLYFFLESI